MLRCVQAMRTALITIPEQSSALFVCFPAFLYLFSFSFSLLSPNGHTLFLFLFFLLFFFLSASSLDSL
ncbi:hypothetical protein EDD21DRAFT_370799, partial [Dissophora ornata]